MAPRYLSPPQTSLLGQLICLNVSLTLPSCTQTHHTQKRIQSRSPLDLIQLRCQFAHRHSHLHSSQPRQKPSRYLGISLSLLSTICVTWFLSTPQLPPDSYACLPSLSTLQPLPTGHPASSLPLSTRSPHVIRVIFLISKHPRYSPLKTLQWCLTTIGLSFKCFTCLVRLFSIGFSSLIFVIQLHIGPHTSANNSKHTRPVLLLGPGSSSPSV